MEEGAHDAVYTKTSDSDKLGREGEDKMSLMRPMHAVSFC